jgi:hypothetical protein
MSEARRWKEGSLPDRRSGVWAGLLLGSLASAVVLNVGEAVVHGALLEAEWKQAIAALGRTLQTDSAAWVLIVLGNSIHCLAVVGLGPLLENLLKTPMRTGVAAAVAVWAVGWLGPTLGSLPLHLFPARLWGIMLVAGLLELLGGALAGQWVYRWCTGAGRDVS